MTRTYRAIIAAAAILMFLACSSAEAEKKGSSTKARSKRQHVALQPTIDIYPESPYRGWDFLVSRLKRDGVSAATIAALYQDPRMPHFSLIPFAVKPRESHHLYRNFLTKSRLSDAQTFLNEYREVFDQVEKNMRVSRYAVTALLMIETHFGKNTGRDLVIYRLSRLASANDPTNLKRNFERLQKSEPNVTYQQVAERGKHLEELFYPEVYALIKLSQENQIDLFAFKGSSAGAFGLPQFLPSSLIKYGYDGNGDGRVDLFNKVDAIWSTANYLAYFGWDETIEDDGKRAAFWNYNRSEAYVDTAMNVKNALRSLDSPNLALSGNNPVKLAP